MNASKTWTTLCVLLLLPAQVAMGQEDYCNSIVTTDATGGAYLFICPEGDGSTLAEIDATIRVTLKNNAGYVIPNMPAWDFWLEDCDPERDINLSYPYSQSSNADQATDGSGETTISGRIAGGKWADGLTVVVQGTAIHDPQTSCANPICLPINVRSPDINGDLVVNIVDLTLLASAYPPQPYQPFADLNGDGVVSLVDLTKFAAHDGHTTPVYTVSGRCENVYSKQGVANLNITLGDGEYSTQTDAGGNYVFTEAKPTKATIEITDGNAELEESDPEKGPYHTIAQTLDFSEPVIEADYHMIPIEADLENSCYATLLDMLRALYHVNGKLTSEVRRWEQFPIDVYIDTPNKEEDHDAVLEAIGIWNDALRDGLGSDVFNPNPERQGILPCEGINLFWCWSDDDRAWGSVRARDDLYHPIRGRVRIGVNTPIRNYTYHELGHALSLRDIHCGNLIMNGNSRTDCRKKGYFTEDDKRMFLLMHKYLPNGLDLSIYGLYYEAPPQVNSCDNNPPEPCW